MNARSNIAEDRGVGEVDSHMKGDFGNVDGMDHKAVVRLGKEDVGCIDGTKDKRQPRRHTTW